MVAVRKLGAKQQARDFREPSRINYRTLAAGLDHYEALGYPYLEVPWVVDPKATHVTLPKERRATSVYFGDLVGSGEQSYIELMQRGQTITKACCITPCFRDEEQYDELHHAYFMKLELINTDATTQNLQAMIGDALSFFQQFTPSTVIETGKNMFDIIDEKTGIELGSYGFRSFDTHTFIYGTGVALPRLDNL